MIRSDFSLSGFVNCVEIDRGGSAIIYRAEQPEFGRTVAIKVLSALRDPEAIERFNTERITMGQLSHAQGIVSVYTSGTTNEGDPYLVLPFYEGGSLQDQLDGNGALRWRRATQHIIQICRSVDFAHSKGVFHRDIKPANLLVADDGNVHIADFGIASLALNDPGQQTLCTPAYAPPEVLRGITEADPIPIDIYGLGATLWALLSGEAPFITRFTSQQPNLERFTMRSWATTHQLEGFAELVDNEVVPDLREFVPDPICATVEQAMEKDPAQRFSSARAFGTALRHAIRLSAEQLVLNQPTGATLPLHRNTMEPINSQASGRSLPLNLTDDVATEVSEPTEQVPITSIGYDKTQKYSKTQTTSRDAEVTTSEIRPTPPPGSQLPEDSKQRRIGSSLLGLAAIVAVVVIAGVALLFAANADGSAPGGMVNNYVGLQLSEVEIEATQAGWLIETSRSRQDGTKVDEVLSQSVPEGTDLDGKQTLGLVLSDGPELRTVPNVVGLDLNEARTKIRDANLEVGEVNESIDESVQFGRVAMLLFEGQEVAAEYETGTKVDIVVSLGPAEVTVPLLETVESAERVFTDDLGLSFTVVEEFSDDIELGGVIRTEPAAGAKAKPGDSVTVYMSAGPKTREIPNVIGQSAQAARELLEQAGFVVDSQDKGPGRCRIKLAGNPKTECDNYAANLVWAYAPTGEADVGTTVVILVKE